MNRLKILFVSARLPFPAIEGHQIRAYGLIKELSKFSDIHLLSILRSGEEIDENNELSAKCVSISGVPLKTGMTANIKAGTQSIKSGLPLVVTKYVSDDLKQAFVEKIKEIQPDIIHLDLLTLAELAHLIPSKSIKVVLNEHNVESDLIHQKIATLTNPIEKILFKREYRLLRKFEKKSCRAVNTVLACSDKDKSIIESFGARDVWTIPNGVDTKEIAPIHNEYDINDLVFLGGMGWYPNRLGIRWFLDEVMPLVIERNPSTHLHLIGNPYPSVPIPETLMANVTKHGFVDDFRPYVASSAMMIVPLNVGSGTRLKVVEGAALAKCMVSTRKGAEGVMLKHGEEIVFADTPQEFAQAILDLQSNATEIERIGKNARKMAENIYDWRSIGEKLRTIYDFDQPVLTRTA